MHPPSLHSTLTFLRSPIRVCLIGSHRLRICFIQASRRYYTCARMLFAHPYSCMYVCAACVCVLTVHSFVILRMCQGGGGCGLFSAGTASGDPQHERAQRIERARASSLRVCSDDWQDCPGIVAPAPPVIPLHNTCMRMQRRVACGSTHLSLLADVYVHCPHCRFTLDCLIDVGLCAIHGCSWPPTFGNASAKQWQ